MKTKEQKREDEKGKNAKGITLIALVVTIIVLIILAGVSIAMVVGDNGIITQAQRAAKETANSTIASEEQMNALVEEMNQYGEGWEEDNKPEVSIDSLKAGDYIKYNSGTYGEILCRVLYPADSEYGLQIISDKSVKKVTLGVKDNFEASKTSYNNAIETLNNEAEAYINPTYALDARCVGSVPTVQEGMFVNKNTETPEPTELQFAYNGSTSIDCKGEDTNYETDKEQLEKWSLWKTEEEYWLASRGLYLNSTDCYFCMNYVNVAGDVTISYLCGINYIDDNGSLSNEGGLRPCILLKSDIKVIGGEERDGTSSDKAYIIE